MKELLTSLANFQQEIEPIYKDKKGFGYNYASLVEILEKINPILKKHNLGFTHLMQDERTLKTIVFHTETAQQIESVSVLPIGNISKGNPSQDLGASITYFRRYHLTSMLGLITDEDTDGVSASEFKSLGKNITQNLQKQKAPTKKPLKVFDHDKGEFTADWNNIIKKRKELTFEKVAQAYTMDDETQTKLKELLNSN